MNKIFLDTSFAIASFSPRDQLHKKANIWLDKIENFETLIVTTQTVFLEIRNALSKSAFRQFGIGILNHY